MKEAVPRRLKPHNCGWKNRIITYWPLNWGRGRFFRTDPQGTVANRRRRAVGMLAMKFAAYRLQINADALRLPRPDRASGCAGGQDYCDVNILKRKTGTICLAYNHNISLHLRLMINAGITSGLFLVQEPFPQIEIVNYYFIYILYFVNRKTS